MTLFQALVLVPPILALAGGSQQLDESNAALDHASGQQALSAELVRVILVQTVQRLRRLGLAGQIEQLRYGALHAEGQLVVRDHRFDLADSSQAIHDPAIELANQVQLGYLAGRIRFTGNDVGDRMLAAAEERALVRRRQEPAAEAIHAARGD